MSSTALKIALLAGLVLLLILMAGAIWFFLRRKRRASSKFGFTADQPKPAGPAPAPASTRRDETFLKTEKFIEKRGQRIADVLVDYASVKGLKMGVYVARPRPDSCVWWIGDKYPNAPKTVLAAVHVGLGTAHGFRSKVVVLAEASEIDTLTRALARAAKPLSKPSRSDGWIMPIAFPGFPLRPADAVEIQELRAPVDETPAG